MRDVRTVVIGAALWALVGCGDNPAAPSPPPVPPPPPPVTTPSVTAVNVVNGSAMPDASYQMMATAQFSDGSSSDVTAAAAWDSSNPQIASITAGGLVSGHASGSVEIRATYQGVSGARQVDIVLPVTFRLSGVVREVAPGDRPLAGAVVRLLDGRAEPFVTDAAGSFRFPGLEAGRLLIEVMLPGFETWSSDVRIVDRDVVINATLYPTPPRDPSGAQATARCTDGSWSWATSLAAACLVNGGVAYPVCPGTLCTTP